MRFALVTVITLGYVVDSLVIVAAGPRAVTGAPLLTFIVHLVVAAVCVHLGATRDVLRWSVAARVRLLLVVLVATLSPLLWAGPGAGIVLGFSLALTLLVIPGHRRWLGFAASAVVVCVSSWATIGREGAGLAFTFFFAPLTGVMFYSISSLAGLAAARHVASGDAARMAVIGERLRLAQDMHDLLGFKLSALLLKSELACRLLPRNPSRARTEVEDTLELARETLRDIGTLARGEAEASLARELSAAEALFVAAGAKVRLDVPSVELPEQVDGVLAIVLREAATNIVRHASAATVSITIAATADAVTLTVVNDAADDPAPSAAAAIPQRGSGLDNLAARLATLGGSLRTRRAGDLFEVVASCPVGRARRGMTTRPIAGLRAGLGAAGFSGADWALRKARVTTTAVIVGYGMLLLIDERDVAESPSAGVGLAIAVDVLAQVGLQLWVALQDRQTVLRRRAVILTAQVMAAFAPLLWLDGPWRSMAGFVAGSLCFLLSARWRWFGYAVPCLVVLGLAVATSRDLAAFAELMISSTMTALIIFGVCRLALLVAEIESFRREYLQLAVTADRLRTDEQLDELLRHDLDRFVAVAEAASHALPDDPGLARERLSAALPVARHMVSNVRVVASGYRVTSFADELAATTATLRGAGIEVTSRGADLVPADLEAASGLILRSMASAVMQCTGVQGYRVEVWVGDTEVHLLVATRPRSVAGATHSDAPLLRHAEEVGVRVASAGGRTAVRTADHWLEVVTSLPLVPAGPVTLPGATPSREPVWR